MTKISQGKSNTETIILSEKIEIENMRILSKQYALQVNQPKHRFKALQGLTGNS